MAIFIIRSFDINPLPPSPGNALIYDIHGKLTRNFLLLDVVTTAHVLECHFWGNGVVAITSDMQIFVAEAILSVYFSVCIIH